MALLTMVKIKGRGDLEGRKDDDLGFGHAEFLTCGRLYFPEMIPTLSFYNMTLMCPLPRDGGYVSSHSPPPNLDETC